MPAVSGDVVVRPGRSPLVVDLVASGRLTAWLLLVGCWPGLGCRASRRVFAQLSSLAMTAKRRHVASDAKTRIPQPSKTVQRNHRRVATKPATDLQLQSQPQAAADENVSERKVKYSALARWRLLLHPRRVRSGLGHQLWLLTRLPSHRVRRLGRLAPRHVGQPCADGYQ